MTLAAEFGVALTINGERKLGQRNGEDQPAHQPVDEDNERVDLVRAQLAVERQDERIVGEYGPSDQTRDPDDIGVWQLC